QVSTRMLRGSGDACIWLVGIWTTVRLRLRPSGTNESKKKKPTWSNTLRYSTTSAYSSTGPPARPSCPSPRHPTYSIQAVLGAELKFTRPLLLAQLYRLEQEKQEPCYSGSVVIWK